MDAVISRLGEKSKASRLGSLAVVLLTVAFVAAWAFTFSYSVAAGIGILLAIALGTVSFIYPFWLVLCVILTLPLGEFLNLPVTKDGLPLCLVLLFPAFAIWVVKAFLTKDPDLFITPLTKSTHILMLTFWLVMVISLVNSSDMDASLKVIKRFTYCVVLYFFIVFTIKDTDQLQKTLLVLLGGIFVAAILGLIEGVSGKQLYALSFLNWKSLFGADVPVHVLKIEPNRIAGPMGNAEGHVMQMIILFYLSVSLFLVLNSRLIRWLLSIVVLLAFANIFGTAYKVGILAFVTSFLIFCYFASLRHKWIVLISSFGTMTVVGFVLWITIPELNVERLFSMKGEAGEHAELRLRNASIALRMFADHPLIGRGPRGFFTEYPRVALFYPGAREQALTAHNVYLEVLTDHGLIGLAVFLLIIISTARNLILQIKKTEGIYREMATAILATLCAYIIIGLGSSLLLGLNFWLLIAIASLVDRIYCQAPLEAVMLTKRTGSTSDKKVETKGAN